MPFFSVIIPVYNKENFIENTLKSVLNQSFIDFEIIVINDGSSDKSEDKILKIKDHRIQYLSKKNEGVSVTRNLGIANAKSDYICFIDADDYWYPTFLEEIYKMINQFPEEKVFSTAIEIESAKNIFPAQYSIKKATNCQIVNYFDASHKKSVIWTSSSVFYKNVFEVAGNFDPNIKIAEDTDLWIRVGLSFPIVFNWKILARYGFDDVSVSRNKKYIYQQSSFEKYKKEEIENVSLKKFLDLNRFSAAIKSKIVDDKENFQRFYNEIDLRNLNFKKRILLLLPSFILEKLIRINLFFVKVGLSNSVFK